MLMNNFTYNSAAKEYRTQQNGLEVCLDKEMMNQETADYTVEILNAYPNRLNTICDVLLADEGFNEFFPHASKDRMPQKLHEPSIRIIDKNAGIISYCNHEYDDTHIIDIEFSGVLASFDAVSIDG